MISSNVVLDLERLEREVEFFGNAGAFVYDVETIPSSPGADDRGVPSHNQVLWVGLATDTRAIQIPLGHPVGTRQIDEAREPRLCSDGKTRLYRVPVYEKPPEQLTRADAFPVLNKLFADPGVIKAAHGATFDNASVAKYRDGLIPAGKLPCTIVMRWLCDENRRRYGLKWMTKEIYKFAYDDEDVGKQVEKHPFNMVAHYLHCDVTYTWLEYRRNKRRIEEEGLQDLFELETQLTSVLSHMRTTGVPIDEARLLELRDDLIVRVGETERKLYAAAGGPFNINATRQKQAILFGPKSKGGQGLKAWKMTDSGSKRKEAGETPDFTFWSTDDDAIASFKGNPVVDALLEYQETSKVLSTYVHGYLGVEGEKNKPSRIFGGRIYPDFVQYGAATGRFSCRNPNLQNVPRPGTDLGKMVRSLFVAEPGHKLIVADYGQIELVLLAHFIGHGNLYDGFLAGIDPHVNTAAGALGMDSAELQALVDAGDHEAADNRQRFGKSINFACVPMSSQALTKDGWKSYDDLNVGDLVLANDGKNAVWTPVLEKVKYDRAPVVRMSNSTWSSWSTPNHRWVADRRTGRGAARRSVREFSTTETLTGEHSIVLSAPLSAEGNGVSARDAAIVAWLHTDGHMERSELTGRTAQGSDGRRRGFSASIFQKKEKFVGIIDSLLDGVPHSRYERPTGIIQWLLDPQFVRDLWVRTGLDNQTLEQFVLGLGTDALSAFYEACWQVEGWTDKHGVRLMCQNEGPVLEAMHLAAYLMGYDVTRVAHGEHKGTRNWTLRMRRPYVTMQRVSREQVSEEDVWCIRTEHENWVMRQEGRIMLTGNTVYGAGIIKLASMMGVSTEEAKKFKTSYDRANPEIEQFRREVLREARRQSPPHVTTLLGRKRRLPSVNSTDEGLRMYAERQLFNAKIQGSSADLTKMAMVRFHQMKRPEWELLLTVHDELVVTAPETQAEECRDVLVESMTGAEMQRLVRLPLKADPAIVDNWAAAKG